MMRKQVDEEVFSVLWSGIGWRCKVRGDVNSLRKSLGLATKEIIVERVQEQDIYPKLNCITILIQAKKNTWVGHTYL